MVNHVVNANNKGLCRGCGATYDMFPGGQSREIREFAALAKAFTAEHKRCAKVNTALRCGCCGEPGHEFEGCNSAHGLMKETWIDGHDTGLSSKTIWCFMSGVGFGRRGTWGPSAPLDPSDFGRCYRLLLLAPEWRVRMPEMKVVRGWAKLAPEWEALTTLFETEREEMRRSKSNSMPRLYKRMHELEGR